MKLRLLDAEFVGDVDVARRTYTRQGDAIEGAQGVLFQCPLCSVGKPPGEPDGVGFAGAHRVLVFFSNPRSAPVAPAEFDDNPRWQMEGTSLDDLALSPSINLDVPWKDDKGVEHQSACKWHGFVKNGDAA
jgi:hypothetical protein